MAVAPIRNWMAPVSEGYDQSYKAQRQVQLANAYASGDPNAVAAQGDVAGATELTGLQEHNVAHQRQSDVRQRISSGDFSGATTAAQGDPGLMGEAATAQQAKLQKASADASFAWDVTSKLALLPPEQRAAGLARVTPILQQHFPGQDFSNLDLSDEGLKQRLAQYDLIRQHVAEQTHVTSDGSVIGLKNDPITGEASARVVYQAPKYEKLGAGESLAQVGGDVPAGGAAAPAPSPATPGKADGSFDGFYGRFLAPHEGGYTAHDGNGAPANMGINQKANPDVGDVRNLTPEQAKGIAHDRYWVASGADKLPPGLAEIQGDTAFNMGVGAAQQLLQQSGGDPQKYLDLRAQRYRAIAANDPSKASSLPNWLQRNADLGQYVGVGTGPAPINPNATKGGVRVIATGAPKDPVWTSDGKGNLVNTNGDRKIDPTAEASGSNADPNMVKMVLEGRYPPPTGRAATDPKWQAVLASAAAQDPSFNAADYHTRYATRKDFTSGKAAQNITSLNTALGHIGDLYDQIDKLGNTGLPMVNGAKNWIETATGDPRIKTFNTTKSAVASELVRVFRQSGGTEADIKDFQGPLDAAGSPDQLKGVVREMTKLLASRLDAMGQQYKQGLGQDKAGIDFLTPKSKATYDRMMGLADADAPAKKGGQATAGVIRYDAQGNRLK